MLDALAQCGPRAAEHHAHGHDRDAHARGNRVGFERFLIAQPQQFARASLDAAQTFAQRPRAVLEFRRQFFIRLADAFQQIGLVREETPGMVPASHEDLALGDADGPGDERALRVVFGKLPEQDHRHLLEQVLRLLKIRYHGIEVAGNDGLGFGPAAGELFVAVHTGRSLTLSLPPEANRYMKSGRDACGKAASSKLKAQNKFQGPSSMLLLVRLHEAFDSKLQLIERARIYTVGQGRFFQKFRTFVAAGLGAQGYSVFWHRCARENPCGLNKCSSVFPVLRRFGMGIRLEHR